jgi:hypothetical protein
MKIYKIITVCFLLTLFSCDDFLNQEPDQQISINEQLSTKNGILESLIGIYRDIEAIQSDVKLLYADVQGGNLTFTPTVSNKIISVPTVIENSYSFNDFEQASDYENYYAAFYKIINQANVILDRFDTYTFLSVDEKNHLEAELLVCRAFSHYQISLLYAQNYNFSTDASHLGIVYNIQPLEIGVDFPSRKTMFETYELLQNDLDTALSLFTNTSFFSVPNYALFNNITTKALYARIALQMNDWEKAFNFSDEIIKTSGITLTSKENYILEWEKEEVPISEIILEFSSPRSSDGSVSSSVSEYFKYESNTNYGKYVTSEDLLDLYEIADIRLNLFLTENLTTNITGVEVPLPYYFTKKFQDDAGTTCIRLSEMYLIRAEANANVNNESDALIDLNTIRKRANLTELTSTNTILEEIFLERRRELAFESHLFFDIARYKKKVVRNKGCLASVCDLDYPSNFFVLPIPDSSIDLNENIQQNEGY